MKFELNPESVPRFVLEGSQVEALRLDSNVSELSVNELKQLIKYWTYEVLESLQEPKELLPLYYHRKQAAEKLGISLPILDELMKTGALPAKRISHRPVVLHEDILNYMRDHIYTATLKEETEPGDSVESFEFSNTEK